MTPAAETRAPGIASTDFTLYVSGDSGSAELAADLRAVDFPVVVVDIRRGDSLERRRRLLTAQFAAGVAQTTVPWLVDPEGKSIGGYEATREFVDRGDWVPATSSTGPRYA